MLLINDDDDLDDLDDDEEDERRMLRHIDMTLYYNIIANTSSNETINNHQHTALHCRQAAHAASLATRVLLR